MVVRILALGAYFSCFYFRPAADENSAGQCPPGADNNCIVLFPVIHHNLRGDIFGALPKLSG